jgi:hypothetical protein
MQTHELQVLADRDAVYYPHIHIQDRTWLNTTLLWFPHLIRMVPENYPLRDESWLERYFHVLGRRNEPLLKTVDFWQANVLVAHNKLESNIKEDLANNKADFITRFNQDTTIKQHKRPDVFTISQDRLFNTYGGLGALLTKYGLAWKIEDRPSFGVHPVLGEAIMATVAMAVAEPKGMDLVTSSGRVHDVLAEHRTDAIYEALVRGKPGGASSKGEEMAGDLASLVIMGAFDVAALTPEDISELHSNREDLADFRAAIAGHISDVPPMSDRNQREKYLHERAADVMHKWNEHRFNFSNYAKNLYSPDIGEVGEDAAKDILQSVLLGGAVSFASAGAGLIVGVVWYAGKRALHDYGEAKKSPYRWLSRIHQKGAIKLPVPLWESHAAPT